MSIFTKIGAWFAKVFKVIAVDADKFAITVTEYIKQGLDTGILGAIAKGLDSITGHVSTEVLAFLQAEIPKALAVELAIQGLPANPTADDIATFEKEILTAIGGKDLVSKSKLWTTFSVQVFTLVQTALKANNDTLTFAQIVSLIEQAYQDYVQDQADPSLNN
jgi:hypothetical protein